MWLLGTFPVLLLLQRWISRHTQIIFLLLTRHPGMAVLLNQLVFLPGVILHELSHWLLARLLGVRTMGFSVWPKRQSDGTVRLGYVQTEKVDSSEIINTVVRLVEEKAREIENNT